VENSKLAAVGQQARVKGNELAEAFLPAKEKRRAERDIATMVRVQTRPSAFSWALA